MGSSVFLCIPPDYDYNFPPLGTPALCAFLKKHGIAVSQADLNIGYRDFLVGKIRCPGATKREKEFVLGDILQEFFARKLRRKYYSVFLPRQTDGVLPYLAYGNNSNSSFFFTERMLSSTFLFRYLKDKEENTFLQYFLAIRLLERLAKADVSLLGISIISPSQALAGLTLGLLVKAHLPGIHVSIGGQWPTLFRKELLKRKDLFACFDSLIVFEGETPLVKLVRALEGRASLTIPNVIFKDTGTDWSGSHSEEDLDSLPCPDFDGLPLRAYRGTGRGGIALTFETSRGCYWGRCAYCVDLPLPKPAYRTKSARLVVSDMQALHRKYGPVHLLFGDPGLSPRHMRAISRGLLKKKAAVTWWAMARLDPGFNRALFDVAFRAGLRQINFGFESASDRVCDMLDKGNRKERSERIIRDCAASGIRVDLQTMVGLPFETMQDGLETVDFLVRNRGSIDHVTFNVYYLTPSNYIYRNPGRYRIRFKKNARLPFRFFTPFKNLEGLTSAESVALQKIYHSLTVKDVRPKKSAAGARKKKKRFSLTLNGETLTQYLLD